MQENTLLVKNMVCQRCLLAVEAILGKSNIPYCKVIAGEVRLLEKLSPAQRDILRSELSAIGLELMDPAMNTLIERIKQFVIKKARMEAGETANKLNLSAYLSKNLYHEYTYLSSLFSSVEGRTIESYFIAQRVEKVKELLVYGEMTLADISFEMEYSSAAHLSNQFKQITGLTPSHFKKIGSGKRALIDRL